MNVQVTERSRVVLVRLNTDDDIAQALSAASAQQQTQHHVQRGQPAGLIVTMLHPLLTQYCTRRAQY